MALAGCSSDRSITEPRSGNAGSGGNGSAVQEATGNLHFSEVAAESGLTETQSDLGIHGEAAMTAGAAVADVDGDGDSDIFLPRVGKPNGLYLNDGAGSFTDVARQAGVAGPLQRFGSSAGAFFDIDADGDQDLFVAGAGEGTNELFVNDGNGHFTEESASRGLVWPEVHNAELGSRQHGVSVADVNGDGFLDLLVLQWYSDLYNPAAFDAAAKGAGWDKEHNPGACETAKAMREVGFPLEHDTPPTRSALFLNDGSGHFRDVTDDYGLALDHIVAFTGVFGDLDGDGWQDLAITGDGCTSRMYRNVDGKRFEDITDAAKVGTDENAMGAVIRDIDGNGTPDLFVTAIAYSLKKGKKCPVVGFAGCSGNRLYLNDGHATFSDATDRTGLRNSGWGWGAAIEDFSNDGTLDVTVVNGMQILDSGDTQDGERTQRYYKTFEHDRSRFWVLVDGKYVDAAHEVGMDDDGISHALVPFDMDGDGDLDILVTRANDTPLLYRNDTPADRSWLTVALDDQTHPGNRWGDGARVEITTDEGADPIVDQVSTGGSYESQKPPTIHHGFGKRTNPLASVEVYWPGETEPQTITGVELNQTLRIQRAG